MSVRVGVDTGGTFTDVCLVDDSGELSVFKLTSTPRDPSEAIVEGVQAILQETTHDASAVAFLGHGTTVATNALLERHGARTGLITTLGFRDLLELARQMRPDLYDLQVEKPVPLVPRRWRLDVPERMRHDGAVETPLDEEAVRQAAQALADAGVEAVAICFLYSYLYPQHELRGGEIVREVLPNAFVTLSHQTLAEFREYERLSTTVANAFIGPTMRGYIERLRGRVREAGVPVDAYITQSNGGVISLDAASASPVRTALSGPAAGITAAVAVAEQAGFPNVITFDMGGTSTDVALIEGGRPSLKMELDIAGVPIRAPMIDINTVGAGGGSIAWIDSGGHLKVGPRSAGADPGPASYGRGGTQATVTDANVALGLLNRETILGGRMALQASAADAAVAALAADLDLPDLDVAQGMLSIVTANMARAIRVISVERGYDPRDFALLAFGGAGPLHAARLARELDIPRVIVPTIPGILCALGLLVADLRVDYSRTLLQPLTEDALPALHAAFAELDVAAHAWLDQEHIPQEGRQLRRVADMRYVGQNYELGVALPSADLNADDLPGILETFHRAHDQAYGFASPDEPVQIVTLRLEASGVTPKVHLPRIAQAEPGSAPPVSGTRQAWLPEAGGWQACALYHRDDLQAGHAFVGPAIVEQMDTTTVVLPGQHVSVDPWGNLIINDTGTDVQSGDRT